MSTNTNPITLDPDALAAVGRNVLADLEAARADNGYAYSEISRFRAYLQDAQEREDAPYAGACALVPPTVKESIFALMASICPALLDVKPVVHFEPDGVGDDHSALWEKFYQDGLLPRIEFAKVVRRGAFYGFRDGSAVWSACWRTEFRRQQQWAVTRADAVDPLTGLAAPRIVDIHPALATVPVYDLPRLDVLSVDRCGAYPARGASIQESQLFWAQYTVSGEALLQGVQSGLYDRDQVLALIDQIPELEEATADDAQYQIGSTTGADPDRRRHTLTLTNCYYRMPDKKAEYALMSDYSVVLHEPSGLLLAARPKPYWSWRRPFFLCRPYSDTDGLFGESVASNGAGHIQDAKKTLLRLAIDAMAFGVNPRLLVSAAMYKKMREAIEENNRPGGLIPFPDAYFSGNAARMQPFMTGYNPAAIIPLMELLDAERQKGTGATEALQGLPTANNITATQAQQIMESTNKLASFMTTHLAEGVSELLQFLHELVIQYMGRPSIQQLWQQINGGSGIPIELAALTPYRVTANSSKETNNRAIIALRSRERLQMLANDPTIWKDPALRYRILHDALQDAGTRNPEDYMGSQQDYIARDQAAQGQQAAQAAMLQQVAQAAGGQGMAAPPVPGIPGG